MIEAAVLDWFQELAYAMLPGPQQAPGEPASERDSFSGYVPVNLKSTGVIIR